MTDSESFLKIDEIQYNQNHLKDLQKVYSTIGDLEHLGASV